MPPQAAVTPTADIRTILDPLPVPKEVKAQAWDAWNASQNDAQFRIKFAQIPLPKEVKAALWDAKQFTPDQMLKPKPATPYKGVEPPTLLQQAGNAIKNEAQVAWDEATGAGQHITKTMLGLGKLLEKVPVIGPVQKYLGTVGPRISVPLEPQNRAQRVGAGAANVGEFYAGGELLQPLKVATQAQTAIPALKAAIGATFEGASAAGVTAAQQGSTENILKPAVTAATLSLAIPAAGELLKKTALKIESVAIKATAAERADGFKTENIFKYKLGGSLNTSLAKTETQLNNLQVMAEKLRQNGSPVDLNAVLLQTAKDLAKESPRNMGLNNQILSALQKEADEIDVLIRQGHVASTGAAPIDTAYDVLKSVGQRGAWEYGHRDLDSLASEKVANALYSNLRKAIEASSKNGQALKDVNRTMMDLIPIRTALIRRIPVAVRNEAMSLPEVIALSHGAVPVGAVSRVLKTPSVANVLATGAQAAPKAAPAISRLGASQATP